jgi:DNA-binding transcriptional ArsR family regulator|tara:strand:+ start:347 stop:652 length:306 start_codon:yes stop_codon:yes gene_type:complete
MERLAEFFKVLSEVNRLTVLEVLKDGPLNVTGVVERTGLSQALVSKHLKLLTIAGIIRRTPEGSLVFYEIVDKTVFKFLVQARKIVQSVNQSQIDAINSDR